jgi:hypothetical protein
VTKSVFTSVFPLDDAQASKISIETSKMRIKLGPFGSFCIAVCLINAGAFFAETNWPASPKALYAQDQKYPFKDYGDREEGINQKMQLVAGEKLLIISAVVENREPMPAENASAYNLEFYLKDTSQVNIDVWEYDKSYEMKPRVQSYPSGLATFSWPSEIPRYFNITPKALFPLAKTSDSIPPIYLPIALYVSGAEQRGQFYSFGFIPLKSITELEYKIFRLQSPNSLHSGKLRDIRKEQKFFISWNGRDQNNRLTASDLYTLVITTKYTPKPGTPPKPPVTTQYQFYHDLDLLEK